MSGPAHGFIQAPSKVTVLVAAGLLVMQSSSKGSVSEQVMA